MSLDSGPTAGTTGEETCPRCGAHARSDAEWCSLCYADLRPAPVPVPVSDPPGPVTSAADVPAVATARHRAGAGDLGEDGAKDGPADDGTTVEGLTVAQAESTDAMLAILAIESRSDTLAGLGTRFGSNGQKVALMVGAFVGVTVVLFALMALLGLLL